MLKMMVGNNLKDTQLQQIVDKTIIHADTDGDGKISFEEFCAVSKMLVWGVKYAVTSVFDGYRVNTVQPEQCSAPAAVCIHVNIGDGGKLSKPSVFRSIKLLRITFLYWRFWFCVWAIF